MIKERLLAFLGDMEGPPSFAHYRHLLLANVLRFPDDASVPDDPIRAYGKGWDTRFRLPTSLVGIEDSKSLIIFEDKTTDAIGLDAERRFLFLLPLPRPQFPVNFYLAWGTSWLTFTASPQRINAGIMKEGEWLVGEPGSEFSEGAQMLFTMQKCESMTGPGVTTAVEQLAYLAKT
jgi:hypothetical protein